MSNINLTEYYSKISEIRNKILSKHKPNQVKTSNLADITFNSNIKTLTTVDRNISKAEEATPLEMSDQRRNINYRVKELDDINGKIKNMLAQRRSVQKGTADRNEKNTYKPTSKFTASQNEVDSIKKKINVSSDRLVSFGIKTSENKQRTSQRFFQVKENLSQVKDLPNLSSQTKDYKIYRNYEQPIVVPKLLQFSTKPLPLIETISQRTNKACQKKKLVQLLYNQVQLDMKLRELKQEFEHYKNPEKQRLLESEIKNKNLKFKDNEIENWIRLYPEERNPFFNSTLCSSFQIADFISKAQAAKHHWENILKEAISIKQLQNQNFTINQIDLGEKGYLTIEDFVCYLNMNSQSCLRNRDVFSMFTRFKKEAFLNNQNKLSYQAFLNYVTK